jgi:hypothetical protein
MSINQKLAFVWLLSEKAGEVELFSHGCCVGADIEAHHFVRAMFGSKVRICVFPSTAKTKAPIPYDSDMVADLRGPLKRNRDIIDSGSDLLIATPFENHEVLRSGTWSAIRYARKIGVEVRILNP